MRPPRFHVRTLMFVAWLAALLFAGAADVVEENRHRDRVEVAGEHVNADGSTSIFLVQQLRRTYFLGPIPIGPYLRAPLCAAVFAASVGVWAWRRGSRRRGAVQG